MSKASQLTIQVLALGALGLMAGAAHSWRTPVHLRLEPSVVKMSDPVAPAPIPSRVEGTTAPGAGEAAVLGLHITLVQAKALFDQGVTFIDARTDRDYLVGAIPGTQHITPAGFSRPETTEKLRFLDRSLPAVVYCGGGDCEDSENLVILLQQAGYTNLHIMTDGFPAWKAAGYEVEVPAPVGDGQ